MGKPIPPLDLMFLLTETADSPKHVSALISFERPAGGKATLVREIVEAYRAATPVAPFTYVPEFALTGAPRWKKSAGVELERHVHHIALPPGATQDELLQLVQCLHEPVLDRNRPGFDAYFIEGLPDGSFVLFVKLHHAIVDGASAMNLLLGSMNEDPASRRIQPFYAVELAAPRRRAPKGLVERALALQKTARKQGTAAASLYLGLLKKGISRLVGTASAGSEPFSARRTPLNETIRTPRSIATLSLPIAEMRSAGKAFGGTLNDVAVTVVEAGLHRYLAGIGKPALEPLVAMCPISLREPGDKEVTTKVTAMFVPLGEVAAPVGERMRAVIDGIGAAKAELKAMSKDVAMLYAIAAFGLGEAEALIAAQRRSLGGRPVANFVLSNVPGSPGALYLNGARMTGMYPISSIAAGMGMNVTLASYAGSMDFGFVGNGLALPHLAELARHTREAFDELKAAAATQAPTAQAPQSRRAPKAAQAGAKGTPRKAAARAPAKSARSAKGSGSSKSKNSAHA